MGTSLHRIFRNLVFCGWTAWCDCIPARRGRGKAKSISCDPTAAVRIITGLESWSDRWIQRDHPWFVISRRRKPRVQIPPLSGPQIPCRCPAPLPTGQAAAAVAGGPGAGARWRLHQCLRAMGSGVMNDGHAVVVSCSKVLLVIVRVVEGFAVCATLPWPSKRT